MFSSLKNAFKTMYTTITQQLSALFLQPTVDAATIEQLEKLLIQADTGIQTTKRLIQTIKDKVQQGTIVSGSDLHATLKQELITLLQPYAQTPTADIYLLIGINGSGKTTVAGKLAHYHAAEGKRVLLVAGDTFRAAAQEQLQQWAISTTTDIVSGNHQQDPGAVVFNACQRYKTQGYDTLIVDTAGRLQTNINLLQELAKIKKIVAKQLPDKKLCTVLVLDALIGQNSLDQAKRFHEHIGIDALILTKMDSTAKGGIVVAITHSLQIPLAYITFGQTVECIKPFLAQEYVTQLLTTTD